MNDCIFCKIIKGEIPHHIIYQDGDTFAFLDIKPINKGHTLVIPKKHYENIYEIPEDILKKVILTTQKIAKSIKEVLKPNGMNITLNNESAAGQVVPHLHFHIMPRYNGDGYQLWEGSEYKKDEGEEISSKIRQHLK